MENEENQEQVFRRLPPSLEIAAAIPTFPQPRGERWKSGNPKTVFPLFHRTNLYLKSNQKGDPAEPEPHGSFRLILRLENA